MAKYSKAAQKSVATAMKGMEKGKLESGRSGKKVTNPKQAIAIVLSEAKKKGAKVPAKKTAKKAAPKKAVKKAAVKKSAPAKSIAKKATGKKAAPAKTNKKGAVKKGAPAKKAVASKKTGNAIAPPPEEIIVLTESAVNSNLPPVEEKSPAIVAANEDPLLAQDKRAMIKATTKSDPNSNLHLSTGKNPVRPSGKKPLWR